MVASENGHLECVRMLIEAGADLDMHVSCDAQPDFDPSAEDDHAEWIPPPLVLAAGNGHQDCVRILIRAGADLNIKFGPCRNSPLHELCAAGRVQMARTLLDQTRIRARRMWMGGRCSSSAACAISQSAPLLSWPPAQASISPCASQTRVRRRSTWPPCVATSGASAHPLSGEAV